MSDGMRNEWVRTGLAEYFVSCRDCASLSKENNEDVKCNVHQPEEEDSDTIFELILRHR